MSKLKKSAAAGGAVVICCAFLQPWEGLWTTAKIDTIGTGQPVTVCYGATKAEIPDLKVGQKFTKEQCAALLLKSLPKYDAKIAPCIHVALPNEARAALDSAAYNAGPAAVCKSQMVSKMNAGDLRGGCEAFRGWFVRARGKIVKGLVNRRNAEADLCLSGLNKPAPMQPISKWSQFLEILKGLLNALH